MDCIQAYVCLRKLPGRHTVGKVAAAFRVNGRVQGVGFRFFVLQTARDLGVTGWVRNLPDGTVEARAEGELEAMESFRRALSQGPPAASVRSVREEEIRLEPFSDFEVRF